MATGKKGDPSLIIGIGSGFGAILAGFLLEGGNPLALIGISAMVIILGGVFGALVTSFSIGETIGMLKGFTEGLMAPRRPSKALMESLLAMSDKSRKEGLLSLEGEIEDMEDPFLKKGLRLVVDGTDSLTITHILETEVEVYENKQKRRIAIFEAAGGFSPTMGIIGTVTGLVLVLSHLGGDAGELGHSIAAAFIATLYGIGLANLVFLPTANKLKNNMKTEIEYMMMMQAVVLSLQNGDSTAMFEAKVGPYIEG
jgi:chemotaxis protein MotA